MQVTKPYVKKFNENGVLTNPLPHYNSPGVSRQIRRGNHRIVFSTVFGRFVLKSRVKSATDNKWLNIR